MTSGTDSGTGRGGLIAWLFGRRKPAREPAPAEGSAAPAGTGFASKSTDDRGVAAREPTADAPRAPATSPSAQDTQEDEDELVLGPALMAPAIERREETQGSAAPEPPGEDHSAGDEAPPQEAPSEEQEEEEELILARLRAAGVASETQEGSTERDYQIPPGAEEDEADEFGLEPAAPTPEGAEEPDPAWLPGEERADGKGELPAWDPGPEGAEPMEAQQMTRDDETDRKEDAAKPETGDTAEAVPLFPGASSTGESGERSDDRDEAAEVAAEAGDEAGRETGAELGEVWKELTETAETETDGPVQDETETQGPDLSMFGVEDVAQEDETEKDQSEPEPAEADAEVLTLGSAGGSDAATVEDEPAESGSQLLPEETVAGGVGSDAFEETVRRLIREELEGELGERLSANIRRMIREEVASALRQQR